MDIVDSNNEALEELCDVLDEVTDALETINENIQGVKVRGIKRIFIIILCLVYILSPVDIIPEALLGPLGFVDDGAVLLKLITTIIFK